MRILVVTNRYPPHITGGYELSCQLATEGLRRRGHDVEVLTTTFGLGAPASDGRVHRTLATADASPSPLRLLALERRSRREVTERLRNFRPAVISAWNLLGLFPSSIEPLVGSGVPVVYHLHDVWMDWTRDFARTWSRFWQAPSPSRWRDPIKSRIGRWAVRHGLAGPWPASPTALGLRHGIFCSQFAKSQHEEAGLAVSSPAVVYNGVDIERFRPRNDRSPGPGVRLLCVGRIAEGKGLHTALAALTRMPVEQRAGLTLTFMGAMPPSRDYYESLVRQIAEADLSGVVRFAPPVPNEEMPAVYGEFDVLVFPSRREGLPRAVLEAMACGLAVVTTLAGGTAELVQDGVDSLSFPPNDAATLAARLELLLKEPSLRRRLGDAARRRVEEQFSMDRTVIQLEQYFLAVMRRGSSDASRYE